MSLILLIQELHPKVRYNRAQLLHSESKNQSRECRDCFNKISFILQGEQGPEYRLLHKGENLTEIFFFFLLIMTITDCPSCFSSNSILSFLRLKKVQWHTLQWNSHIKSNQSIPFTCTFVSFLVGLEVFLVVFVSFEWA